MIHELDTCGDGVLAELMMTPQEAKILALMISFALRKGCDAVLECELSPYLTSILLDRTPAFKEISDRLYAAAHKQGA